MTTSRENPALAAMRCNQSLVTLNSSNSMSGSFHCTSQLTVIKSWFTLIRSKNNDEIIWNLPSADVLSLKSCKKYPNQLIHISFTSNRLSLCVVNISLPCPRHTTWPPCLQASALWLTASKRWKEKPQYNKNWMRATPSQQRWAIHFSLLYMRTQRGRERSEPMHSAAFYLLTSRHLIIMSAYRLWGQLTSANTQVNHQFIGHLFTASLLTIDIQFSDA